MADLTLDDLRERHGKLWKIWRTPHGGVWLARRHQDGPVREAMARRVKGLHLTFALNTADELLEAIEEQDRILERNGS